MELYFLSRIKFIDINMIFIHLFLLKKTNFFSFSLISVCFVTFFRENIFHNFIGKCNSNPIYTRLSLLIIVLICRKV